MKTSDEIKKGLACRILGSAEKCDQKCSTCQLYVPGYLYPEIYKDALSLIQQLEAENAKLKRERDALLALLREYAACETCKYECPPENDEAFYNECIGCDKEICKCRECGEDCDHWEWRGPCEENTENP